MPEGCYKSWKMQVIRDASRGLVLAAPFIVSIPANLQPGKRPPSSRVDWMPQAFQIS